LCFGQFIPAIPGIIISPDQITSTTEWGGVLYTPTGLERNEDYLKNIFPWGRSEPIIEIYDGSCPFEGCYINLKQYIGDTVISLVVFLIFILFSLFLLRWILPKLFRYKERFVPHEEFNNSVE